MSETNDTQEQPKVEIVVKNFGPIAEANIDLRPLTVFVGPSNTGKTYFATLVYALQSMSNSIISSEQIIPFHSSMIFLLLNEIFNGQAIPETELHKILRQLNNSEESYKYSDLPIEMRNRLHSIIKEHVNFKGQLEDELKNCFNLNSYSEIMRLDGEQDEHTILLKASIQNQEYWNYRICITESKINIDTSNDQDMVIIPRKCSVVAELCNDNSILIKSMSVPNIRSMYYLPAARSGIMHSHRIIASSLVKQTTRVGIEQLPDIPTMSSVIADFLERIILFEENSKPNGEMKNLANLLETSLLDGLILLKPSASGYPDFRYLPQGTNHEIRLSQASSMVSELAPLVLYLRGYVKPGDTLIIEEPEAHLHPGAQADMAVILVRLVRVGVKVIITTHSDWLLQEIGNLIRAGELEKSGEEVSDLPTSLQTEEVGIWHFQKNGMVEEIPYNRIDGIEPMEYLDVAEDLYNRSARLQNRLEELKGEKKRESE
ncbi:MAG: AAA family ATPase [Candidatus Poribacteria bacterium]|nr:AAA family ATPase [Candidatus Poribacteria bacterium]